MKRKKINILVKGFPLPKYSGEESEKARKMFEKFLEKGLDYDELSRHPDFLVYASAELLKVLLPQIFDELIKRRNTSNFLIYPLMSTLEPDNKVEIYQNRFLDLISTIDEPFKQKVHEFLALIGEDHPAIIGRIERLSNIWK